MRCKTCGSPKEKDEAYEMPTDTSAAPTVTDEAQLQEAQAGANWKCVYCGGSVRNLHGECQVCGGPKTAQAQAGFVAGTGTMSRSAPDAAGAADDPLALALAARRSNRRRIALVVLAVLGLFAGVMLWIFLPHDVEVKVAAIRWERTVELQQRQTNHGTGWDDSMPAGSFNVSCSTRQRGTEDCNPYTCNCRQETDYCSEECNCRETCSDNGNGYATCTTTCSTCSHACGSHEECDTCYEQCPVYDDWCSYSYYTWPTIDREVTSGRDHTPYYGDRLQAVPGANQRLAHSQIFEVHFADGDDHWDYTPETLEDYVRFDPQADWLIEVNRVGNVWPQHPIVD